MTAHVADVWAVFDEVATRLAERPAVEVQRRDSVERFSYGDLRELALDRAAWLTAQGVSPGDRCAILADNDAHWCAAYLGILRIGAVAVPLDTNYSAKQVAAILRDAGALALFVGERLRSVAQEASAGLPDLTLRDVHAAHAAPVAVAAHASARVEFPASYGEVAPKRPDGREAGPAAPAAPDAPVPALILYTSGTTADPKGVVLTHANLLAERDALFQIVSVTDRDSVLGVLPLFHALAQLANLLLPFAVGARVVFLETVSSTELLRALAEREITIFACVPQFFCLIHQRVLGEVGTAGAIARVMFRSLLATSFRLRRMGIDIGPLLFRRVHGVMGRQMRLFITGGSKFDPAVGRDLYALGFTILQAYGLTETSGAATITRPDEAHLDTVGRALPGQQVRILASEPPSPPALPAGPAQSEGEIAVRGPIVMQGYFGRPEATTAVMRDGWFLTGDLGRLDADGRLTITGRKKEMIVLPSGKNIYPEEIEAHYRQSPFIKEIAVMGLTCPHEPTSERLHAVIVPNMDVMRERRIVNAGDLIRFEMEGLAVGLPPHKRVLGYDVWFEPLPRTTTGKLKRHEIQHRVVEKHAAPSSEQPDVVSSADEAWLDDPHVDLASAVIRARAVSGVRVLPDANLELDLGLDSMERVELLTDLEQKCGVKVPEERLHDILTVRQLVEAFRPVRSGRPPGSLPRTPARWDGPLRRPTTDALATDRAPANQPTPDESWSVILRDLPSPDDPVLSSVLRSKPLLMPVLFITARLLRVILARVDVSGREHLPERGAFIISPNHQGYLDPVLVCGTLPYRVLQHLFFVGAAEYFETPLTRWLARQLNVVPVDPDANLVPAMKAGAFGLKHGKVLMLFPEGERSIDGTVRRFKKGAGILARQLGVPIVPVALKGSFELWPRNRPFNWQVVWPWSSHRVRVQFGQPLRVEDGRSDADVASDLRTRVVEMWEAAGVS